MRALSKIYKKYGFNDYLIFGGDNLFTSELNDFVDYFKKQKSPITAVFQSTQDMELKNFGTLYLDPTGKIIQFAEKSENPQSNLIATCIYAIPNSSMNLIDKYLEGNNPDSPGYFIEWLSKIQNVFGFKLSGTWWDIGTLQAYTRIQEAFKAYYDTS